MTVLFEHRAASGRVRHHGLKAMGFECLDVVSCDLACRDNVSMVGVERATAADIPRDEHPAAVFRQDADRGSIGVSEDRPHNAARQESHPMLFAALCRSLLPQALADEGGW